MRQCDGMGERAGADEANPWQHVGRMVKLEGTGLTGCSACGKTSMSQLVLASAVCVPRDEVVVAEEFAEVMRGAARGEGVTGSWW